MRLIAALLVPGFAGLAAGCTPMTHRASTDVAPPTQAQAAGPEHPMVRIHGIDGTDLYGELLNGTVTIECGQGELTLQTDHVFSLTLAQDVDKVDAASVNVTGKLKDTQFLLRNEHGVFQLKKERLQQIDFTSTRGNATGSAAATQSASSINTYSPADAPPRRMTSRP